LNNEKRADFSLEIFKKKKKKKWHKKKKKKGEIKKKNEKKKGQNGTKCDTRRGHTFPQQSGTRVCEISLQGVDIEEVGVGKEKEELNGHFPTTLGLGLGSRKSVCELSSSLRTSITLP